MKKLAIEFLTFIAIVYSDPTSPVRLLFFLKLIDLTLII